MSVFNTLECIAGLVGAGGEFIQWFRCWAFFDYLLSGCEGQRVDILQSWYDEVP